MSLDATTPAPMQPAPTGGMAPAGSSAALPTEVELDGWVVSSSSTSKPTEDELRARVTDEPAQDDSSERDVDASGDSGSTQEPGDGEQAAAAGEKPDKARRSARERKELLQAEINALTRQKHDARRAFEAEQAAIEKERKELGLTQQERPTQEQHEADVAAGMPTWDDYEAEGKTFAEYERAKSDWLDKQVDRRAEQAVERRLQQEREERETRERASRRDERLSAVKTSHPDFDEAMAALDNADDTPLTRLVGVVVDNHRAGFELLYHLGKHPAEAATLAALTDAKTEAEHRRLRPVLDAIMSQPDPIPLVSHWANNPDEFGALMEMDAPRQLMALGRLIERLSSSGAKTGSPGTARISNAPAPIRPVGAARPAGTASRETDDDDIPFGPDYVRQHNERMRRLAR